MTELEKAIAEVKRVTGDAVGWDGWDFYTGGVDNDEPTNFNHAEATILNAVASGELIPATERDAAVAAALRGVIDIVYKAAGDEREMVTAILALITQPQADATERDAAVAVTAKPLVWTESHGIYYTDTHAVSERPEGGWVVPVRPIASPVFASLDWAKRFVETGDAITQPAADALARVRAEAVKIKPLAWEGFVSGNYHIEVKEGGIANLWYYSAAIVEDEEPILLKGGYLSLVSIDDLKAAAQADYDARIRAVIGGVE